MDCENTGGYALLDVTLSKCDIFIATKEVNLIKRAAGKQKRSFYKPPKTSFLSVNNPISL